MYPVRLVRSKPRGVGVHRDDAPRFKNEPVNDYYDALYRVFQRLEETGEPYLSGDLPWIVHFIADMFWISPETVRQDLLKIRRSL